MITLEERFENIKKWALCIVEEERILDEIEVAIEKAINVKESLTMGQISQIKDEVKVQIDSANKNIAECKKRIFLAMTAGEYIDEVGKDYLSKKISDLDEELQAVIREAVESEREKFLNYGKITPNGDESKGASNVRIGKYNVGVLIRPKKSGKQKVNVDESNGDESKGASNVRIGKYTVGVLMPKKSGNQEVNE